MLREILLYQFAFPLGVHFMLFELESDGVIVFIQLIQQGPPEIGRTLNGQNVALLIQQPVNPLRRRDLTDIFIVE